MRLYWANADTDNMWAEKDSSRATDDAFLAFFRTAYTDSKDAHWAKANALGLASSMLTSITNVWEDVRKK